MRICNALVALSIAGILAFSGCVVCRPVDENIIGEFLEAANYSRESILTAAGREACSTVSGCCIHLLSPLPGYQVSAKDFSNVLGLWWLVPNANCANVTSESLASQHQGDNISVPRMAQAEAAVTLQVSGENCVEAGADSLRPGQVPSTGTTHVLIGRFVLTWYMSVP
eukprot:1621838-Rhodomonas_salina.2